MRVGMYESISSPIQYWVRQAGKRKVIWCFEPVEGNGWTDGGTEKGRPNTCRPIRSHKDSAPCLHFIPRFTLDQPTIRWT